MWWYIQFQQSGVGIQGVQGQPQLQSKFEASLGYMRPYLKNQAKENKIYECKFSLNVQYALR